MSIVAFKQEPIQEFVKRVSLETGLNITPGEATKIIKENTISQPTLDGLFNRYVKAKSQTIKQG